MSEINSEQKIILELQAGNSRNFSFLVEKYSDKMYQFLYVRFQDKAEIEDVVQETFIKAYQNILSYNPKYQFSTWLYTIAYREMIRVITKNKNHLELTKCDVVENPRVSEDLGIWEAAGRLPVSLYTLLWLKYHEELEIKEIAFIVKSSVAMVKINLFRARNQLRNQLENEKSFKTKEALRPKVILQSQ